MEHHDITTKRYGNNDITTQRYGNNDMTTERQQLFTANHLDGGYPATEDLQRHAAGVAKVLAGLPTGAAPMAPIVFVQKSRVRYFKSDGESSGQIFN